MPLNREKVKEVLLKSLWYILLYLVTNYIFVHLPSFIRSIKKSLIMTTAETELNHSSGRFQSIAPEEAETIVAGESLFYWAAYGVGKFVHMIATSSGTQSSGQRAMNAAL